MVKRNILIVTIAFGLIVALLAIYFFFYRRATPVLTDDQGTPFPQGTIVSSSTIDFRPPPVETPAPIGAATEPRLFQIHDNPIVSAVSFLRKNVPYVRFIEQGSGHVYEYNFVTKQKVRISNTSVPQIGAAIWAADGSALVFRYEQDGVVKSAVGLLASSSPEGTFDKIFFLPESIRDVAISPNGKSVFYLTENTSGGVGVLANRDGSNPHTLFSSPLKRWRVEWQSPEFVIIQTPMTTDGGGVAYKISIPSGAQTVLISSQGLFGGVTSNSDGQLLATNPQTGKVSLFDSKLDTFSDIEETSWPAKCSFISGVKSAVVCGSVPTQALPLFESWGRGEFVSNDILIAINFLYQYKELLIPQNDQGDRAFDITNVSAVPGGNWIVFKNRPDGLLWGVRVPGGVE